MISKLFHLGEKNILITGGAQGIGAAFAHALGEMGAELAIFDKNKEVLTAKAEECNKLGFKVHSFVVDVTDRKSVTQSFNLLMEKWQKLDVVINNVGIGANSPAEETSETEWSDIINTNLNALFFVAQTAGKIMLKQGDGHLINTASMSSIIIPYPQKQAAYNTSKAGVVQLTKSLASEWAERGVRVNCISPGIVQTDLINTDALKTLKTQWIAQNPMKRLATVDDLKGAIVYLASDAASYMNGHNLVIDGGHSLR